MLQICSGRSRADFGRSHEGISKQQQQQFVFTVESDSESDVSSISKLQYINLVWGRILLFYLFVHASIKKHIHYIGQLGFSPI